MRITLKAARVNKKLSLKEMSKELGISTSTINRWEREITPIPDNYFIEFCKLCDVDTKNVKANIKLKVGE